MYSVELLLVQHSDMDTPHTAQFSRQILLVSPWVMEWIGIPATVMVQGPKESEVKRRGSFRVPGRP